VVLLGAPEPVLWRHQADESGTPQIREPCDRVLEVSVHRCLVGEERDAVASDEAGAVVDEDLEPGFDARHAVGMVAETAAASVLAHGACCRTGRAAARGMLSHAAC
jgi:hypothetical protein